MDAERYAMKSIELLVMAGMATLLVGCASAAKMESMAYVGPNAQQKVYDDDLRQEVSMGPVSGGSETSAAWTSEIGSEEFSGAVRTTLQEQGLLSDNGKFRLTVMLVRVDQPLAGLNMTVTTEVRYILRESASGEAVLDETVVASHTATVGDAFAGVKRLRLANEGSARKNIERLLEVLAGLEIGPEEISLPY
jgi:hypothetical protein